MPLPYEQDFVVTPLTHVKVSRETSAEPARLEIFGPVPFAELDNVQRVRVAKMLTDAVE